MSALKESMLLGCILMATVLKEKMAMFGWIYSWDFEDFKGDESVSFLCRSIHNLV